jgi:hypothetical protein
MGETRVSQSAVSSLKAIFSILMGLSVTNTLVVLIHRDGNGGIASLADVDRLHAAFAAVLLFTIARFYLGNVRHVDDFYVSGTVDGRTLDPRVNSDSRFIVDFTVLLIEALMFSLASFYVVHPTNFVEIAVALLAVDILWTVTTRGVAPHSGFWFSNNLIHMIGIAVCFGFHLEYDQSLVPFYFAIGLLLTNGILDFAGNRSFYFSDRRQEKAVFLSAPFTQLLTENGLPAAMRERLSTLIDHLEAEGWAVGSAHRRENWGKDLDSPYFALGADLQAIDDAGVVIAILGAPPSPGVQMEIGFALARQKKLILIGGTDNTMPYLVRGVIEQKSVMFIHEADSVSDYQLGQEISAALDKLAV